MPFRGDSFAAALDRAIAAAPASVRAAGRVPAWIVKNLVMRPLTRKPRGTMAAVRVRDREEVAAHYGSWEAWERIGGWESFVPPAPSREPALLDHGYDESKPAATWSSLDLMEAASFRGGDLLSHMQPGDIATPMVWRCALGHVFAGSPRLILRAGHWCPDCVRDTSTYERQAEENAFLRQVVSPQAPTPRKNEPAVNRATRGDS